MKVETQRSEMVLLNQMSTEELAKVLVELIKGKRELRQAILGVVWNCPSVVKEI